MANIVFPKQQVNIQVTTEGANVVFQIEKRGYRMPYQTALAFANVMIKNGKIAEEYANAEQVVMDGAILLRSGAPFGISDNPKINEEIKKEAVSNRLLRTSMTGGVKSREQFGTPSLILGDPQQEN